MPGPLKILMVAAEAVPFVKTGGLADVIGSLPAALRRHDCDVRVAIPRYAGIASDLVTAAPLASQTIDFEGQLQNATIHRATADGVPFYLIDAPQYYNRQRLYGFEDDALRFGFFCRACLDLPQAVGWQPDVIHCHDWHAALLPVYQHLAAPARAATVFTVHNLAYQGVTAAAYMPRLGLPWELFNYHQLEFYGQLNPMKGGLVFADALTTVSRGYAAEITTAEYGAGLNGVLRERADHLAGILNGIDYARWNPRTDPHLTAHYGPDDLAGKAACKRDLLQRLGLPLPGNKPMPVIGIVSRLSEQKGFDLVERALEAIVAMGCYLVVLGSGSEHFMRLFAAMQRRYPRAIACELGRFNNELAHRIYAGSDIFLMPSHYEPCGLGQMIALAYGTVPVVRATGGLADTVHEFDVLTGEGNGFVFHDYTAPALIEAVRRAVDCYRGPGWNRLVANTFACDFSWDQSALQYIGLYESLLPQTGAYEPRQ